MGTMPLCRLQLWFAVYNSEKQSAITSSHPKKAATRLAHLISSEPEPQARSLELRTATSLGRLWRQQGHSAEAYPLLAEVYGWFSEGFDTADLQEAETLLAELAQSAALPSGG
jgi:predicted ATPase